MSTSRRVRSARLALRATPEQQAVDRRLLLVSDSKYQALLDMMDSPGLAELFS